MMEYKGYIAAVEYDDLEEALYGRVINAGSYPVATFEATDVQQLHKEFHHSVDEYLASCKEDDVEPRKPFSGKLQLQIPPDLHARVAESAVRDGMSIDSWIEQALGRTAAYGLSR